MPSEFSLTTLLSNHKTKPSATSLSKQQPKHNLIYNPVHAVTPCSRSFIPKEYSYEADTPIPKFGLTSIPIPQNQTHTDTNARATNLSGYCTYSVAFWFFRYGIKLGYLDAYLCKVKYDFRNKFHWKINNIWCFFSVTLTC